jgi:hypothetical protein
MEHQPEIVNAGQILSDDEGVNRCEGHNDRKTA